MKQDGTEHRSLGIVDEIIIEEINVAINDGDDGWARVNIVSESGDSTSALVPKDVAHNTALELSPRVIDEQYIEADTE